MILKIKKIDTLLLLSIIALASLFRLTNLDLMEFKTDEATNLLLASRPASGRSLLPGGIAASFGILNPPLFIYLLSPIAYISQNPKLVTFVIAFVNSLSIGILFLTIKKYYSKNIAFIVCSLIAVSPWSIILSRKIWPPDLVLLFTVLLIYSLHKIIIEKKSIFWISFTVSLSFIVQLDMAYVVFGGILFLAFLFTKPKFNIRYFLIGILIGVIPLMPYFAYQIQKGCADCSLLFNIGQKFAVTHNLEIFKRQFQLVSGTGFRTIMGNDTLTFAQSFPLTEKVRVVMYLGYPLLILGIIMFWKLYPKLRFLVYTTILTPLVYFAIRLEPDIHYFVVLLPFLFIFLGNAIGIFMESKLPFLKYAFIDIFILIFGISVLFNISFFNLLDKQKVLDGDYGKSFIATYPSREDLFKEFRESNDYHEILLSSYIPLYLMHGKSSFAQMLYPSIETEANLKTIEKTLAEVPNDHRAIHKLLVFYTTNPTRSTLDVLKEKTKTMPQYDQIYKQTLALYLQRNYKRIHQDLTVPFTFEYPEHWTLKENHEKKLTITVSDENYLFSIKQIPENKIDIQDKINLKSSKIEAVRLLGKEIQKINCFANKKYCGTVYTPIEIEEFYYQIEYKLKKELYDPDITVMDDIVDSLRINEKYYKKGT